MSIKRTALTLAATAALVLLPASAFAGSNDGGGWDGDGKRNCQEYRGDYRPGYAPQCPDRGDHRHHDRGDRHRHHHHTPSTPTTTTTTTTSTTTTPVVVRTLHTL